MKDDEFFDEIELPALKDEKKEENVINTGENPVSGAIFEEDKQDDLTSFFESNDEEKIITSENSEVNSFEQENEDTIRGDFESSVQVNEQDLSEENSEPVQESGFFADDDATIVLKLPDNIPDIENASVEVPDFSNPELGGQVRETNTEPGEEEKVVQNTDSKDEVVVEKIELKDNKTAQIIGTAVLLVFTGLLVFWIIKTYFLL